MILKPTACGWLLFLYAIPAVANTDLVGDYKVILERNPFGLKPPPPPPKTETNAPPETPVNYKLTGMTALFKRPRAMFVNQLPGKATPEYISLSEGQRHGGLEVLVGGLDFANGTVRVKIAGEEHTLSFAKNGITPASGPTAVTQPVSSTSVPRPLASPVLASKPATSDSAGEGSSVPTPPVTSPPQAASLMASPGLAGGLPAGSLPHSSSTSPPPISNPIDQIENMRRQAYRQANTQINSQPAPPTAPPTPAGPPKR